MRRTLKAPELTGDEQQEYINIIQKSGDRMLNIINDIVSISNIESGLVKANIHQQILMSKPYISNLFQATG
ncbi:MAG: hypothetical protein IPH20_16705 [Bacteroidales bacterium]|nr:hypothetical protein [Bacteroidales bacterium]